MSITDNSLGILSRSKQGATLALVVAVTVLVVLIGVFCFFVLQLLGGSRETQNATDSGNLNIGKQAIQHPTITLNQGVESDNFGGLVDDNGNINLLNYNRLAAQTLLVAAN